MKPVYELTVENYGFYMCFDIGSINAWLVDAVVKGIAIGAVGLGSIPGLVKSVSVSPTAGQCCVFFSELFCPGS